jgi:hypothetical protein
MNGGTVMEGRGYTHWMILLLRLSQQVLWQPSSLEGFLTTLLLALEKGSSARIHGMQGVQGRFRGCMIVGFFFSSLFFCFFDTPV